MVPYILCVFCTQPIHWDNPITRCPHCLRSAYDFTNQSWFISAEFAEEVGEFARAAGLQLPKPAEAMGLVQKLCENLSGKKT